MPDVGAGDAGWGFFACVCDGKRFLSLFMLTASFALKKWPLIVFYSPCLRALLVELALSRLDMFFASCIIYTTEHVLRLDLVSPFSPSFHSPTRVL